MNPLIVALDVEPNEAKPLIKEIGRHVEIIKIGSRLFTAFGPKVIDWVHENGSKVFLDLKFHDISKTVSEACRNAVRMKVWGMTIHTSGGFNMMHESSKTVYEESKKLKIKKPLIFGITVLTSLSDSDLKEIGVKDKVIFQVKKLALLAKKAGLDGVVSSGNEIETIRKSCGKNFLIMTPGIRPASDAGKDDQKRVMTPAKAISFGADYLVVGRPILEAKDRLKAIEKILDEMREVKK